MTTAGIMLAHQVASKAFRDAAFLSAWPATALPGLTLATAALVLGLVLLVGALDYLIFSNIDNIARRLNPTSLIVSEIVFGVLLTAVAVQLFVYGIRLLGIIEPAAASH